MKRFAVVAVSLVALGGLVSCGGGGGDGVVAPAMPLPAAGLYSGALTGSTSPDFQLLVLDGGEFWAFYGTATPPAFAADSFAQGKWISNGGLFTSADVRDFSTAPATVAASRVSYNTTTRAIEGTISALAMTPVSFNGTPITASTYNHNTPALPTQVAGIWRVEGVINDSYCLNVATDGTFSGVPTDSQGCVPTPPITPVAGCSFTGSFSPQTSGKNVFKVDIANVGSQCTAQNLRSSGVAVVAPRTSGDDQLILATVSSDRNLGLVLSGVR